MGGVRPLPFVPLVRSTRVLGGGGEGGAHDFLFDGANLANGPMPRVPPKLKPAWILPQYFLGGVQIHLKKYIKLKIRMPVVGGP